MKRALICASFVCVIGAALGMLAVPAAHAATVNCSGTPTFPNNRTGNDLNVPAGATCTLSNVTVGGDVIVQPGGNLVLLGATVGGNLFTNAPGSFRIDALSSSCAGTTCTQPSLIRGNATFSGTSSVPAGFTKNSICNGSRIGGNVILVNSTAAAPWAIGSACAFGGASFGNDVLIQGNAARVDLANSRVGNRLQVQNNTGAGSIVNNTIAGSVVCANNTPAYTASGNKGVGASALAGGTC